MQRGERQERDCQLRETESDMASTVGVRKYFVYSNQRMVVTKESLTVSVTLEILSMVRISECLDVDSVESSEDAESDLRQRPGSRHMERLRLRMRSFQ